MTTKQLLELRNFILRQTPSMEIQKLLRYVEQDLSIRDKQKSNIKSYNQRRWG